MKKDRLDWTIGIKEMPHLNCNQFIVETGERIPARSSVGGSAANEILDGSVTTPVFDRADLAAKL